MPQDQASGSLAYTTLLAQNLQRLAAPGAFLTSRERLSVASLCRSKDSLDGQPPLRPGLRAAALKMAYMPNSITEAWISGLEEEGLDRLTLLEALAVVSRQVAMDTFILGVGGELSDLPEPVEGEPTQRSADDAQLSGWLPTVGPAQPQLAFTALPNEQIALRELSHGLYIDMTEIFNFEYKRDGLTRDQMELVASRTSFLNECFY